MTPLHSNQLGARWSRSMRRYSPLCQESCHPLLIQSLGSYVKCCSNRPNYPTRPFSSKEEGCQWVSSFVDWYNHQHRDSGIKFVTPHQLHSGEALEICRQRSRVYELARIANPKRWSTSIRCWKQSDLVCINEPLATQQTSLQVALASEA